VFRDSIYALVENTINLSLGLISAICISAFFLAGTLSVMIASYSSEKSETDESIVNSKIEVGAICALLYVAAFTMSFQTSAAGKASFVSVVSANICYMLLPVLAFMGALSISRLAKKLPFLGVIISASAVMALLGISSRTGVSVLLLLALLGAIYVILSSVDKWATVHFSKGDNV
jgi:hypothetical protein